MTLISLSGKSREEQTMIFFLIAEQLLQNTGRFSDQLDSAGVVAKLKCNKGIAELKVAQRAGTEHHSSGLVAKFSAWAFFWRGRGGMDTSPVWIDSSKARMWFQNLLWFLHQHPWDTF